MGRASSAGSSACARTRRACSSASPAPRTATTAAATTTGVVASRTVASSAADAVTTAGAATAPARHVPGDPPSRTASASASAGSSNTGAGDRGRPRAQVQQLAVQHAEAVERRLRRERTPGRAAQPPRLRRRRAPVRPGRLADQLQHHRDELGDRHVGGQREIHPSPRRQHAGPAPPAGRDGMRGRGAHGGRLLADGGLVRTGPADPERLPVSAHRRARRGRSVRTGDREPMGSTVGLRRPRRDAPHVPGGELVAGGAAGAGAGGAGRDAERLLPLVMVGCSLVFVLGARKPTSWLFGGMFAFSALGMMAAGGGRGARRAHRPDRRGPPRLPALPRPCSARGCRASRPSSDACWRRCTRTRRRGPRVLAAERLWERRPSDPDFGQLRVGRGPQRLATRLTAPQTGPVEGLEPISALALRRFLRRYSVVPDLPVACRHGSSATVRLEPDRRPDDLAPARALARALVAQYALWHSPADAQLAVVAPPAAGAGWEWAKWLPHTAHPRLTRRRRPASDAHRATADTVRRWWARRAPVGGRAAPARRDGRRVRRGRAPWAGAAGRHACCGSGRRPGTRAAPSVVRLTRRRRAAGPRAARTASHRWHRAAGRVSPSAEAAALARRLARYRPGGRSPCRRGRRRARVRAARPARARRPGPARVAALRAAGRGRRRPAAGAASASDERGRPGAARPQGVRTGRQRAARAVHRRHRFRQVRAAAHARARPGRHALADELNLVLVDFKGGATFLGFADLPHVSAVITNLADELTLVDRMADALAGRDHPPPGAAAGGGQPGEPRRLRRRPPRPARAAAAARAAHRGRRVLRAARPAPRADRPDGHDRPARPLAGPAPAARLAAPRRGPAARAGVAPVVPHRAAHVLRVGVAGRARRAGRAPAAADARARRSSPRAPTSSSGSAPPTCPARAQRRTAAPSGAPPARAARALPVPGRRPVAACRAGSAAPRRADAGRPRPRPSGWIR